jgi:branched-chain amino acid transport system permease protein
MIFSIIFHIFLTKTKYGISLRATGQDAEAAQLVGINIKKMYALSFGLGISCTAVAGSILSTYYPLNPYIGSPFLTMMFITIVLGGLGNYGGAFISGLFLGVIEMFTGYLLSPLLKQTVPFFLFILILLLKPQGIFGKEA